jgi:threonine dehydrogenase-like Zn-dependent dehydrogenase
MKAVTWHGRHDMRVDEVDDPSIEDPRDVIVRITASGICGSDLHLYNGFAPAMKPGDIIGHEPMGEVVEVGSSVSRLKKGDKVVVPFTISCGSCFYCDKQLYSLCDESNPNAEMAEEQMGHSPAGLFGYTHLLGGYSGGQAEYLRVPFADVGPIKVPDGIPDEKVVFLSDIFPTGYMAAENAEIEDGDTVAIWGCGPVGQFAIQSAWMLGAGRVIAIDSVPERLAMAREHGKAETLDFTEGDVVEKLIEMTDGHGPDRCIDAVGAEAHAAGSVKQGVNSAKETVGARFDRPYVLQQAIQACRKGGTISVPGVYFGEVELPWGPAMNKALTFRMGQTHVQRYLEPLLQKVLDEEIDPSFVITDTIGIDEAPDAYATFESRDDGCIKVVIQP